MSIEKAREYLKNWNKDKDILEFSASSATVELAARALNTEEERIAKSLSFIVQNRPILIIAAGDVKIDNKKYKKEFGMKARMMMPDEVRELIGYEIGGVCPFGVNDNVEVYLDESLKRFETIYPACGSSNSAIQMTSRELEEISRAKKWIDVCKNKEQ